MMTLAQVKPLVYAACKKVIEERVLSAQTAMDEAQASANQEEKSSAGDKYETGRAMAQLKRDQAAQIFSEALKLRSTLTQIDYSRKNDKIGLGSLVITSHQNFFLSVNAGKLLVDDRTYLAISIQSPIGKLLLAASPGETIHFNKQAFTIVEVW